MVVQYQLAEDELQGLAGMWQHVRADLDCWCQAIVQENAQAISPENEQEVSGLVKLEDATIFPREPIWKVDVPKAVPM